MEELQNLAMREERSVAAALDIVTNLDATDGQLSWARAVLKKNGVEL